MRFSLPAARRAAWALLVSGSVCGGFAFPQGSQTARAIDPGVRHAATDNGPPLALSGLAPDELASLQSSNNDFAKMI